MISSKFSNNLYRRFTCTTKNKVQEMVQFNNNAQQYDTRKAISYPEELFLELASLSSKHEHALDIGCGNGISSNYLSPFFTHVTGVDFGNNLITSARRSFKDISFKVIKVEEFESKNKFDLITSANSFYWMDRKLVLNNMRKYLNREGVFCPYKYNFPIVYGRINDFISYELVTKWSRFRDPRLTDYDNTLELMRESQLFKSVIRKNFSNIIDLSPEEVADFFLSTSYVTKYIESTDSKDYAIWFKNECSRLEASNQLKVNFDIQAVIGLN